MSYATDSQVRYILFLLKDKGYSVTWMDSSFKKLGVSMRDRKGRVSDWVKSLNVVEASSVIDALKRS